MRRLREKVLLPECRGISQLQGRGRAHSAPGSIQRRSSLPGALAAQDPQGPQVTLIGEGGLFKGEAGAWLQPSVVR